MNSGESAAEMRKTGWTQGWDLHVLLQAFDSFFQSVMHEMEGEYVSKTRQWGLGYQREMAVSPPPHSRPSVSRRKKLRWYQRVRVSGGATSAVFRISGEALCSAAWSTSSWISDTRYWPIPGISTNRLPPLSSRFAESEGLLSVRWNSS